MLSLNDVSARHDRAALIPSSLVDFANFWGIPAPPVSGQSSATSTVDKPEGYDKQQQLNTQKAPLVAFNKIWALSPRPVSKARKSSLQAEEEERVCVSIMGFETTNCTEVKQVYKQRRHGYKPACSQISTALHVCTLHDRIIHSFSSRSTMRTGSCVSRLQILSFLGS